MATQRRRLDEDPGPWELDLTRRELRTHGAPVPLGGRAFDIVEVLARSAGELVTKDEIMPGFGWARSSRKVRFRFTYPRSAKRSARIEGC